MPNWLKLLWGPAPVIRTVPLPELITEDLSQVPLIVPHPGFRYLYAYLQLAIRRVEVTLATEKPSDLGRIGYLQGLRTGLRYVEDTVTRAGKLTDSKTRDANATEQQIFEQVRGLLKEVR